MRETIEFWSDWIMHWRVFQEAAHWTTLRNWRKPSSTLVLRSQSTVCYKEYKIVDLLLFSLWFPSTCSLIGIFKWVPAWLGDVLPFSTWPSSTKSLTIIGSYWMACAVLPWYSGYRHHMFCIIPTQFISPWSTGNFKSANAIKGERVW